MTSVRKTTGLYEACVGFFWNGTWMNFYFIFAKSEIESIFKNKMLLTSAAYYRNITWYVTVILRVVPMVKLTRWGRMRQTKVADMRAVREVSNIGAEGSQDQTGRKLIMKFSARNRQRDASKHGASKLRCDTGQLAGYVPVSQKTKINAR